MASILLVDDDKTFLNGLKMFFGMENIQVSTTTTVSTAKVLLDTEDISLVCTDWQLPDGTGLDVLAYASHAILYQGTIRLFKIDSLYH